MAAKPQAASELQAQYRSRKRSISAASVALGEIVSHAQTFVSF
jgi:hypothetical protein